MTASQEVIIVGGGAIGAACARELALRGWKVTVLDDAGVPGIAWRAAAGMLAPQIEAAAEDPGFELALAGRERYREIAGPLEEATGISLGFWQEGIARLAMDEADVAELKQRVAWQRQQGHVCDWFDEEEARNRWPWAGKNFGVLWAPHEAALEPVQLVEALLEDARRHGARVVNDKVYALQRRGDRVTGVVGGERYEADHTIIAAGAWSPAIGGLPRPLPVVPIRGQMAALPWPEGVDRGIVYGKHSYIVARGNEAIAGSTMEHAGYSADVTPAGLAHIFTSVSAVCPALAKLDVIRTWAGLRPVTPDGLPIIGREPSTEGLWYATGHGRNGILLAAITGFILSQLLAGEQPDEDLTPFRPERFFDW